MLTHYTVVFVTRHS